MEAMKITANIHIFLRYGIQLFGTGFKSPTGQNEIKENLMTYSSPMKGKIFFFFFRDIHEKHYFFFGKKSILVELNRHEGFIMCLTLEPHSLFFVFDS